MRITFFASALAFALSAHAGGNAGEVIKLASEGALAYATRAGKTRFEVHVGTKVRHVLVLSRDAMVSPSAAPSSVKVVAEMKGPTLILIDTYPSVAGGMSLCKAGEERFLRVLAMSGKQPKETLRIKLESCRENIELAAPGIVWQAPSSTLNLDWLQGPMQKGMPESRVIRIDETGHPR